MVQMRSPSSIICDSALSVVVLPEPVPPEITMLSRAREAIFSTTAISGEMEPLLAIVSSVIVFLENLRIEIEAPSMASGGAMMLTRLPSARRASTSGVDSSMRRPMAVTMRVAIAITWPLSRNVTPVSSSLPLRSI